MHFVVYHRALGHTQGTQHNPSYCYTYSCAVPPLASAAAAVLFHCTDPTCCKNSCSRQNVSQHPHIIAITCTHSHNRPTGREAQRDTAQQSKRHMCMHYHLIQSCPTLERRYLKSLSRDTSESTLMVRLSSTSSIFFSIIADRST